mmetsp:Transcript_122618/g.225968  ORF Transcript_122618/g.225968 Transcript_122618/m.225968 type:complete len:90 (-) Transcript_122618:149-418(-)
MKNRAQSFLADMQRSRKALSVHTTGTKNSHGHADSRGDPEGVSAVPAQVLRDAEAQNRARCSNHTPSLHKQPSASSNEHVRDHGQSRFL